MHPTRDELSLALDDGSKHGQRRSFKVSRFWEVTIDHVAREAFNGLDVAARGEILEGPDADVTRCDAGQDSPGHRAFSKNTFTRQDGCERPRCRNPQRMHCFADEIFAQDRPQCGAAIAPPGERCWPRTLQLDIAPLAVPVQDLAKEDCTAVAKLGNEIAELMRCVGHCDRLGAGRMTLPANTAASSSGSRPSVWMPSSEARASLNLIKCGFATGVGESRAKKRSGRRA